MLRACCTLFSATAAFCPKRNAVVRLETIVGNITVPNNDAPVWWNHPGTLLGSRSAEGSRQSSETGQFLDVDGLGVEWRNATGTRSGLIKVDGSL